MPSMAADTDYQRHEVKLMHKGQRMRVGDLNDKYKNPAVTSNSGSSPNPPVAPSFQNTGLGKPNGLTYGGNGVSMNGLNYGGPGGLPNGKNTGGNPQGITPQIPAGSPLGAPQGTPPGEPF